MENAVEFHKVDVVFGTKKDEALRLFKMGKTREEIASSTNSIIGVSNISFNIKEGEICVLMGLSGSGKSSLLRCINKLNIVSNGSIYVKSNKNLIDITKCNSTILRYLRRKTVAMVFQQFALFPWRTVEENVGFSLEIDGMNLKNRRKIINEKLHLVGLEKWGKKYAHELSGGMQQRVGLARAFATDAPILLMDEPFSALDPLIRSRLQDELIDLQKKLNKTIVFVSHDLDEAMKLGNSIVIMENGTVIQHGTPEDIALRPANKYVSNFVSHMNPVKILQARSIMRKFPQDLYIKKELIIDKNEKIIIHHNNGTILSVQDTEKNFFQLAYYTGTKITEKFTTNNIIFLANEKVLLKDLIKIRSHTYNPILLTSQDKISGIIGRKEFFESLNPTIDE